MYLYYDFVGDFGLVSCSCV